VLLFDRNPRPGVKRHAVADLRRKDLRVIETLNSCSAVGFQMVEKPWTRFHRGTKFQFRVHRF
jgi:hypothetical protein